MYLGDEQMYLGDEQMYLGDEQMYLWRDTGVVQMYLGVVQMYLGDVQMYLGNSVNQGTNSHWCNQPNNLVNIYPSKDVPYRYVRSLREISFDLMDGIPTYRNICDIWGSFPISFPVNSANQ